MLNFYRRKGSAYFAMQAPTLFFPWLIVVLIVIERIAWELETARSNQVLGVLLVGYILIYLLVFLVQPHRNRWHLYSGIALHISTIVAAILVLLYQWWLKSWTLDVFSEFQPEIMTNPYDVFNYHACRLLYKLAACGAIIGVPITIYVIIRTKKKVANPAPASSTRKRRKSSRA